MVCDTTLRHNSFPVGDICIVPKCKDAGCRNYRWKEGFGPGVDRVTSSPRRIAIAGKAVNEDDAKDNVN